MFLFFWKENGHTDVQILDFCFLDCSCFSFGEETGEQASVAKFIQVQSIVYLGFCIVEAMLNSGWVG